MSIIVRFPDNYLPERNWITHSLLSRLTDDFVLSPESRADWQLSVSGQPGAIHFADVLIPSLKKTPNQPLPAPFFWEHELPAAQLPFANLPVLQTSSHKPMLHRDGKGGHHEVDVFGMAFWAMCRWEEIYSGAPHDEHDRFPAESSYLLQHGLLERPWVDEWMCWLRFKIENSWQNLPLKPWQGRTFVSHDVDNPFLYAFTSPTRLLRSMAGDTLKRYSPITAMQRPLVWWKVRQGKDNEDPYFTFNWIMDRSESAGVQSAFYFICGHSGGAIDGNYDIENPRIRRLLRHIHERGHEIGLHPSYGSYLRPELILNEFQRLREVCDNEGINQDKWGARMHYLRWNTPQTLYGLENSGLDYDSTLGFADFIGFRCGTCHEYQAFDPVAERQLNLKIRPLLVMDSTILDTCYMGLGTSSSAYEKVSAIQDACKNVNGNFTLLWHNCRLEKKENRDMYEKIIRQSLL